MITNQESYVVVYNADCTKRCAISMFELLALAHRPHATPLLQLEMNTFRLRGDDPIYNRIMFNVHSAKTRLVVNLTGQPWTPPPVDIEPFVPHTKKDSKNVITRTDRKSHIQRRKTQRNRKQNPANHPAKPKRRDRGRTRSRRR